MGTKIVSAMFRIFLLSKDLNQSVLAGNLVCDPEFLETKTGNKIYAKLKLATARQTSEHRSEDSEFNVGPDIHQIHVHVGHMVEMARKMKKGDRIVVGGEIRYAAQMAYIILLAPNARFYKVL